MVVCSQVAAPIGPQTMLAGDNGYHPRMAGAGGAGGRPGPGTDAARRAIEHHGVPGETCEESLERLGILLPVRRAGDTPGFSVPARVPNSLFVCDVRSE